LRALGQPPTLIQAPKGDTGNKRDAVYEFSVAAPRLAESNERLTKARKGNYIVDSPQRNPKGCKESSRWSESAETTGNAKLIRLHPGGVPDLSM